MYSAPNEFRRCSLSRAYLGISPASIFQNFFFQLFAYCQHSQCEVDSVCRFTPLFTWLVRTLRGLTADQEQTRITLTVCPAVIGEPRGFLSHFRGGFYGKPTRYSISLRLSYFQGLSPARMFAYTSPSGHYLERGKQDELMSHCCFLEDSAEPPSFPFKLHTDDEVLTLTTLHGNLPFSLHLILTPCSLWP